MSANQSQSYHSNPSHTMSGFESPPFPVIDFTCHTCKSPCWIDQQCIVKYECDGLSLHTMHPVNGIPTRCCTCVRIALAVCKLKALVIRKPYLLTEGMAAAPEKEAWEEDPDEKEFRYDSDEGFEGDEREKREEEALREKMVKSFIATAGKGFTEEEMCDGETVGNGRESRASTRVEEEGGVEWEGETEAGDEEGGMVVDDKNVCSSKKRKPTCS
jgi:hypothetical protein